MPNNTLTTSNNTTHLIAPVGTPNTPTAFPRAIEELMGVPSHKVNFQQATGRVYRGNQGYPVYRSKSTYDIRIEPMDG